MSFKISILTGKLYNDELVEIPFDTNNELYLEFESWLQNGNSVIYFDGTKDEMNTLNLQKAIQIDLEYKDKITKLLNIPIQKVICEELEAIPADILAEKERLKTECNEKIIALGVTDFSFRKKVTINLKA